MADFIGDIVGGALGLLGAGEQADAAGDAANASADASRYATDVQKQMFDKQIELQAPWRRAGEKSVNFLSNSLLNGGLNSKLLKPYQEQKFTYTADPGYQFRINEGANALNRSAAARGGLQSGAALKAAARYGQEMGSQEYNNAWNRFQADQTNKFNRYTTNQTNQYNRLAGLAGLGQQSATQTGNAASNYASNIGNLAMTNAANQGNALIAQGNINSSMYGGLANAIGGVGSNSWSNIGNMFGGNYGASGAWLNPDTGSLWSY